MDAATLALKDRVCDATDRIPTSRWPFFSQSLECTIAAGDTSCVITFAPERDTLLTDLSILVFNERDVDQLPLDPPPVVDIEYCNVAYGVRTDVSEWAYCCQRKPIFLVGVRESKKLRFTITLDAAIVDPAHVELTVSGFQGDGCCN